MTEKEKKEQLVLKQRAELRLKKGTAEIPAAVEKKIAIEVLSSLETELSKLLLTNDLANNVTYTDVNSGDSFDNNTVIDSLNGTSNDDNNSAVLTDNNHASAAEDVDAHSFVNTSSSSSVVNKTPIIREVITTIPEGKIGYSDITQLNLDELFDLYLNPLSNVSVVEANRYGLDTTDAVTPLVNNDFAAELIYIMRTSMALT